MSIRSLYNIGLTTASVFIMLLCCTAAAAGTPLPDAIDTEQGSGYFGPDDDDPSSANAAPHVPLLPHQYEHHTPSTPAISDAERAERLRVDIGDFLDLIPADKVRAKIRAHFRSDADVQTALLYVNGKEFNAFDVREVQELVQWMSRAGVNIKAVVHRLDDLLGVSKLGAVPVTLSSSSSGGGGSGGGGGGGQPSGDSTLVSQTTIGLNGLLEDVLSLIPQDEIFILFFEKLDSSIPFATLVESIGSPEFGAKFDSLKRSPELKNTSAELHKHKIDVRKIIELLQSYFLFGSF